MGKPVEYVTSYTRKEGGAWLTCRPWKVPEEARLASIVQKCLNDQVHFTDGLKLDRLHSFRTSAGREWDVVNGWRKSETADEELAKRVAELET